MIKPGQTVFLDGGTTTAAICRALPLSLDITVVTHSPTVAIELVDRPAVQVLLTGGTLYRHSLVTVGAIAAEYVNNLNVDVFFMGVSGVHPFMGLPPVMPRRRPSNDRSADAQPIPLCSRHRKNSARLGATAPSRGFRSSHRSNHRRAQHSNPKCASTGRPLDAAHNADEAAQVGAVAQSSICPVPIRWMAARIACSFSGE
jgi:DeoR C terminal sensor domain